MKKNTIVKIVIALLLLRIDIPVGVDLFPNFIGYILLLFAATDLMRLHKNMWWLRCSFLALSALSFVMWLWQPTSAFITIPFGLACAGVLFMFVLALAQIYDKYLDIYIGHLDKFAYAMLLVDVIFVIGAGLMGSLFFLWASIINLILMMLIDIRLYSAYSSFSDKN